MITFNIPLLGQVRLNFDPDAIPEGPVPAVAAAPLEEHPAQAAGANEEVFAAGEDARALAQHEAETPSGPQMSARPPAAAPSTERVEERDLLDALLPDEAIPPASSRKSASLPAQAPLTERVEERDLLDALLPSEAAAPASSRKSASLPAQAPLTERVEERDLLDALLPDEAIPPASSQKSAPVSTAEAAPPVGRAEEGDRRGLPPSGEGEKRPEAGSVYKEVPAVPEVLRRIVENKLLPKPSVQAKWEALVDFMDVSNAEKAQVHASLDDLWGSLIPALSVHAQRLLQNRLNDLHNQVSRELEGSDLSSKNFQRAFYRAQHGLERVTHSAIEAIAAICSNEK